MDEYRTLILARGQRTAVVLRGVPYVANGWEVICGTCGVDIAPGVGIMTACSRRHCLVYEALCVGCAEEWLGVATRPTGTG